MDRKIINILAILAAAVLLIVGGWYVFNTVSQPNQLLNAEDALKLRRVQQARSMSRDNIRDFLKGDILEDLQSNTQYQQLQDLPIQINMDNVGNAQPFKTPPKENQ